MNRRAQKESIGKRKKNIYLLLVYKINKHINNKCKSAIEYLQFISKHFNKIFDSKQALYTGCNN